MVSDEHGAHAFVMEGVGTRCDEERLTHSDGEKADTTVGRRCGIRQ